MNLPRVIKIHIMLNKCAQNGGHYHLTGILHQVKLSSFRGQPHLDVLRLLQTSV